MEFPRSLNEQLNALSEALDDPATDLLTILDVLSDDLISAIPSFVGLTMTLQSDGTPVTLTAIDEKVALTARASLRLPIGPLTNTVGSVVFYAVNPGAFVDLAEDIRRIFGLDGQVVVDGHLPDAAQPPGPAGISGLAELSVINRAIGVLIDQGLEPAKARAELHRIAAADGHSVPESARRLLAAIGTVADPEPPGGDVWQRPDPSGLG